MATEAKDSKDQLDTLLESALNDLLLGSEEKSDNKSLTTATSENVVLSSGKKKLSPTNKSAIEPASFSGLVGEAGDGSSSTINRKVNEGDVDLEEMNKFFENMTAQLKAELPKIDPEEAKTRINESVPQIFDMMQNLLSKELLYPALKDLAPKFDEWLKKKSSTLSNSDKKRFKKQKNIINEMISIFDDESLDAQVRFERHLDLMEKMQSLGSPPEELTVPEGVGKCSVM